jgi:hypothetical protein
MRKLLLAVILVLFASPGDVGAVGLKTQMNCASDYYAYCSQFAVGTSAVRKCMRDNGPRLSKACVNALIADGEISKAEVERTKDKILVANSKPKQAKKVAEVADASAKSKPNVSTSTEYKPILKRLPKLTSKTELVIDQNTYRALRGRVHFLAAPEELPSTVVQSLPPNGKSADKSKTLAQRIVPGSIPAEPSNSKDPRVPSVAATTTRQLSQTKTVRVDIETTSGAADVEPNKSALPTAEKSQVVEGSRQARGPVNGFAGKMSLGNRSSAEQANEQEPTSQAWGDYMQSRFNGGMNYEGLGARFSKGR